MLKTITTVLVVTFASIEARAESSCSLISPGDLRLRHDVQLLDDAGKIRLPTSSWPMASEDLRLALSGIDESALLPAERAAFKRLAGETDCGSQSVDFQFGFAGATNPRVIRSFEGTPRDNGALRAGFDWQRGRLFGRIAGHVVANASDGDTVRPDGTYVGARSGNWMLTAGWQDKWWGPGRDGSTILSTNARPLPSVTLQRRSSSAFSLRWLSWIGPWNLTAFMAYMDDDRVVDDTLLVGMRFVFVPLQGLEIGLSRTAQWCGQDRSCNGSTFVDLLLGNDNRGVNVDPENEPGNQLGGVDLRWSIPGPIPVATYLQWTAEDTRQGGPAIGSWLRLAGVEYTASLGASSMRAHFEIAETSCRDGGAGFSELVPNCAYEHEIYRSGYRYQGRPIGHGMDGDGLSYSAGATLVQSRGHIWNVAVRAMEINRTGASNVRHSLSATPQDRVELQVSHRRSFDWGVIYVGLGYRHIGGATSGNNSDDVTGFMQWSL